MENYCGSRSYWINNKSNSKTGISNRTKIRVRIKISNRIKKISSKINKKSSRTRIRNNKTNSRSSPNHRVRNR